MRNDWGLLAKEDDPVIIVEWLMAVQRITETFISKNKDYGTKNITSGWTSGVVVRLGDKVSRLWNLVLNLHKRNVDETVEDTFLDVAAYAIIGYLMATGKMEQSDIIESVGLPALVRYWVTNNTLTKQEIDDIMSLLVMNNMVNEGFPGKISVNK